MRKILLGSLALACVAAVALNGLGQSSNQSVADAELQW